MMMNCKSELSVAEQKRFFFFFNFFFASKINNIVFRLDLRKRLHDIYEYDEWFTHVFHYILYVPKVLHDLQINKNLLIGRYIIFTQ